MMIFTKNDGPDIVESGYWGSELEARGGIAISVNSSTIRLLMPRGRDEMIADMIRGCDYVVFNIGYSPSAGREMIQIVFEDHTAAPFSLLTSFEALQGFLPSEPPPGRFWMFSIWTYENGKPVKKFQIECCRRKIERIKKAAHGLSKHEEQEFKRLIGRFASPSNRF